MRKKGLGRFCRVVLTGSLAWGSLALAADGPVIEAIEGDQIVVIRTPKGNRVGTKGSEVSPGEVIKTGARASVRIRYPDGSKLLIGNAAEVEVQDRSESGTQWSEVRQGRVRGIVKKATPGGEGAEKKSLHRFAIRSPKAVMGVRGTDFVFEVAESAENAQVHTFEGLVEVATDEAKLALGQGVGVPAGQFVSAGVQGVSAPQTFDAVSYFKALSQATPEFVKMSKETDLEKAREEAREAVEQKTQSSPPVKPEPEPLLPEKVSEPEKSAKEEKRRSRLRLGMAELAWLHVEGDDRASDDDPGRYSTGQLAWTPEFDLPIPFLDVTLRGHMAIAQYNSRTSRPEKDEKFFAIQHGLRIAFKIPFLPLQVDAGGGTELWTRGQGGVEGFSQANLSFLFGGKTLDHLFVGIAHHERGNPKGISGNFGSPLAPRDMNSLRVGLGVQL